MGRLVINGEEVYELDEECLKEKYKEEAKKNMQKDKQMLNRKQKNICK